MERRETAPDHDHVNWGFNISTLARLGLFFVGIIVLSIGAATVITANIGAPTWDVLHIGLANITPLSMGAWVQIIGIFMLLMTAYFEKKWPSIGSIANIVIIGFLLNYILEQGFFPVFDDIWKQTIMLVTGVVIMGLGSGMYVASKVGAGPRDGLTLYLAKRFSISIRLTRTLIEGTALLIGWLIGGPAAWGTFVTVFLIGPVLQASLQFWTNRLEKWENRSTYISIDRTVEQSNS